MSYEVTIERVSPFTSDWRTSVWSTETCEHCPALDAIVSWAGDWLFSSRDFLSRHRRNSPTRALLASLFLAKMIPGFKPEVTMGIQAKAITWKLTKWGWTQATITVMIMKVKYGMFISRIVMQLDICRVLSLPGFLLKISVVKDPSTQIKEPY